MIIIKVLCEYSHLDASELLRDNYSEIDLEIYNIIHKVVGEKSKVSKGRGREGKLLYSPKIFKSQFNKGFEELGFNNLSNSFYYSICSSNKKVKGFKKVEFCKDKVGVQVQFGKYTFMLYDLSKFQYFYDKEKIEVGVEILPSYSLQKEMSSGMGYGEQLINDIKLLKNDFPKMPIKIIIIDVE